MNINNIDDKQIKNARNKGIIIGVIISLIIFTIIIYAYKSFYNPNQLRFISYTDNIFSYEINNKYLIKINIPDDYELFDSKASYKNCGYILGRFKNQRIYAQVGILSSKNNILAPGQDYLTKDLWNKKFAPLNFGENGPIREGFLIDDNKTLYATLDIYTDFSRIKDGHMAVLNILYEYNFFPISIYVVIHSDDKINFDTCISVYHDWRRCIIKNISQD